MKNRVRNSLVAIVFGAIVIFLAVDVGYFFYNPDRFTHALPFCTLNIINGSVEVQTKDTVTWKEAQDDMVLEPGSRVRTAPDSYASLVFSQGTTTKLEPDTDLIVAKLEGSQDAQPDIVMLQQRSGETWNQVAKQPSDSIGFQIQTPSADVAVHGTLFSTRVDKSGKTSVQTTEGLVSVSAEGKEVQVPAGQQTNVTPGEAPSAPVPIPPATNALIVTITKPAVGRVVDSSGSSTGYLPDGTPLNQIVGSRLSPPEESSQTIQISEPNSGGYNVVVDGSADGNSSIRVEGFAGGKNTFTLSDNISAAVNMVLDLHLDVLDGLLQGATVLNLSSADSQQTVDATPSESVARGEQSSAEPIGLLTTEKKTPSPLEDDREQVQTTGRLSQEYRYNSWVVIITISIVVLFAVIWVGIWRNR